MTITLSGVVVVKRKHLHHASVIRAVHHLPADVLGMVASVTRRSIDTDGTSRLRIAGTVGLELVALTAQPPATRLQGHHHVVNLFVNLSSDIRSGSDPIAVHNCRGPPSDMILVIILPIERSDMALVTPQDRPRRVPRGVMNLGRTRLQIILDVPVT